MSWLGTGIGAGLGLAFGGPIGAAIGAFVGSKVSNKLNSKSLNSQQSQQLFFVSLFSMLGKMAKADGVVTRDEIQTMEGIMKDINLDKEDRKAAIQIFNNAKTDPYSIYEYAAQFHQINPGSEMSTMAYRMLFAVSMTDGVLHPEEKKILREMPPYLGLDSSIFSAFEKEYNSQSNDLADFYAILECSPNSTDAEVKKAYRNKAAEFHPDKIASKGLPESFMKFAHEQMEKVNEAYEVVMKSRKK